MKISFPIYKENGNKFLNVEEITAHLNQEVLGRFLVGKNKMFHGGIHITEKTTPWAKTANGIRAVADGVVAAYRISKDYQISKLANKELKYSTSFVLLKHNYKVVQDKKKIELVFYSLYMHIAPLIEYKENADDPTDLSELTGSSWNLRRTKENTLEQEKAVTTTLPPVWEKEVNVEGIKVKRLIESRTFGKSAHKFAFVEVVSVPESCNIIKAGDYFWITTSSVKTQTTKSKKASKPNWVVMLEKDKALKYDVVETLSDDKYQIKAGEVVGNLGLNQEPENDAGDISCNYMVHIETFTTDKNIENIINNSEKLDSTKKYIKFSKDTPIFKLNRSLLYQLQKNSDGTIKQKYHSYVTSDINYSESFNMYDIEENIIKEDLNEKLIKPVILRKDEKERLYQDKYQNLYYKLPCLGDKYLAAEKGVIFTEYDFINFDCAIFKHDSNSLIGQIVIDTKVNTFYQILLQKLLQLANTHNETEFANLLSLQLNKIVAFNNSTTTTTTTSKLIQNEIVNLLYHDKAHNFINKLVIYHQSEWLNDSDDPKWSNIKNMINEQDDIIAKHNFSRVTPLTWMQKSLLFQNSTYLWYFHPITFLELINNKIFVNTDGIIENSNIIFNYREKLKDNGLYKAEKGALERINGIVLHRTASGKMQKTKDILDGFKKNGTHFLIDRDGTIYQAASLLNATQHVGPIRAKFKIDKNLVKSKDYHNGYDDLWKDGQAVPIWTNSTEYNQRRIGVFFRESYKPYPHRYVYNRDSIGIEVVASYDSNPKKQTSPLWESTTKEQLASIRYLVNLLKSLYNLSDEDVYKHNVIAYKTDNEADELYEPQNHY